MLGIIAHNLPDLVLEAVPVELREVADVAGDVLEELGAHGQAAFAHLMGLVQINVIARILLVEELDGLLDLPQLEVFLFLLRGADFELGGVLGIVSGFQPPQFLVEMLQTAQVLPDFHQLIIDNRIEGEDEVGELAEVFLFLVPLGTDIQHCMLLDFLLNLRVDYLLLMVLSVEFRQCLLHVMQGF